MCRHFCNFLLTLAMFGIVAPGMGLELPAAEETPFQWLAASGETSGVRYATRKLQAVSLQNESGPPMEIREEEVRIDAQTTRITRQAYMTSVNGERRLVETSIEEIRKLPGDRVQATRTVSRRDPNGRFGVAQKEVQEMAPSGSDSYLIKKTLLQPGMDGNLVEREQIQQTERRKGNAAIEIERIRSVQGLNGGWNTAERRVSQNTTGEDQTQVEERVYRPDVNNRMALKQQIRSTEWKDAAGRHLQSESYDTGIEGKLLLSSRVTSQQTPLRNGRQQTTEILEESNPVAPGGSLRTVRKTVESLQSVGAGQTEKRVEILEPDLNGGWQSIHGRETIEKK